MLSSHMTWQCEKQQWRSDLLDSQQSRRLASTSRLSCKLQRLHEAFEFQKKTVTVAPTPICLPHATSLLSLAPFDYLREHILVSTRTPARTTGRSISKQTSRSGQISAKHRHFFKALFKEVSALSRILDVVGSDQRTSGYHAPPALNTVLTENFSCRQTSRNGRQI